MFTIEETGSTPPPIVRPKFEYPDTWRSSKCTIKFSLTKDGKPFDIPPDCSDEIFNDAAIVGLKKGKWHPQDVEQHGLTYRTEFSKRY